MYLQQKYFVTDRPIQQLITLLRNNIFQRNWVIGLAIYWGLSEGNFIEIRSNLTFPLYDV